MNEKRALQCSVQKLHPFVLGVCYYFWVNALLNDVFAHYRTYVEFLARLLEDKVERRAQKQLLLRLRRASVNTTKTLEGFDWSFNPTLNRQQILALASGDYIRQHHNVLICGLSGVGKSHLAQALGHEACRQGFDVLSPIPIRCCRTSMEDAPTAVMNGDWRCICGPTC